MDPAGSNAAQPVPVKFQVNIPEEELSRLKRKLEDYELPNEDIIPDAGWSYGVSLDWVKSLKKYWLEEYDWRKTEGEINQCALYLLSRILCLNTFRWDNFKVVIEDVHVHFVHQRSPRPDAIPLLIVHGWPGTFYEFHQIIEPLINPPAGKCAFDVIIPSVPGFGFSSTPRRQGWTVKDTARIFDKLVTDILGYKAYMAQGGDWVSQLAITGGTMPTALNLLP